MKDGLHILQHSLGVDEYGEGRQYRNHFVTSEGSTDYPKCMDLVERGLMTRRPGNELTGGGDLFQVTHAGVRYVAEHSEKKPRLTRSQARYQSFLSHDCGMTFREWLRIKEQA